MDRCCHVEASMIHLALWLVALYVVVVAAIVLIPVALVAGGVLLMLYGVLYGSHLLSTVPYAFPVALAGFLLVAGVVEYRNRRAASRRRPPKPEERAIQRLMEFEAKRGFALDRATAAARVARASARAR